MLKKISIGFIFLLFAIISPDTSFVFNRDFRVNLIADAINFCPQELKVLLKKNQGELIDGMLFVSRNRKSVHMSGIGDVIEYYYNHLVKELKAGKFNEDDIIRSFGLLAGFVSETICPGRIYSSDKLIPDTVRRENFQKVTSVKKEILGFIEKYRPYRNDYRKETMGFLYGEAVNRVVNFWLSVWKESGHKITDFDKIGPEIDHRKYATEKNDSKKYISGSKVPYVNKMDRQNSYIWLYQNR